MGKSYKSNKLKNKMKTATKIRRLSALHSFLQKAGIKHSKLSEAIGMPYNTFKSKIALNDGKYDFTEEEQTRITKALCKIKEDINKYCNC